MEQSSALITNLESRMSDWNMLRNIHSQIGRSSEHPLLRSVGSVDDRKNGTSQSNDV